jgi:membrane fusion protein, multidrug efflux system
MSQTLDTSAHEPVRRPGSGRRRAFAILGIVVLVSAVAFGAWWFLYARYFVSTDDAYVSGYIIAVTARVPGTVLAIHVDNTQAVRRGQPLVELDPADSTIAFQAAEADLAHTVRQVNSLFSKAAELQAQIAQARVQLSLAQSDYERRIHAIGDGAVSQEDLTHARDAIAAAKANLDATQNQHQETLTQIRGTTLTDHPDVLAAEARLRTALLNLDYTRISAPVDGEVAQRNVQLGQQIAAGWPLMAVVPLDDVWVDANFKEVQLQHMRIGQPVTITADVYGGSVKYHGRLVGLSAGSGAAFALLPPQNATGNWIKIVQRVPVRIALDPRELRDHPLRIGLSVYATVDVHDQSGGLVAWRVRAREPEPETSDTAARANAIIAKIIADNSTPSTDP